MALKTCIECGKEHTDTIANCPHCGYITKEHPSIKVTQNEPTIKPKEFKFEGFMDKGIPLMNTLRVLGSAVSAFIVGLFFVKYMIGYIVVKGIFVLVTLPYFHHNKKDHKVYKIISYMIWWVLFLSSIHTVLARHILDIETSIYMNKIISNIIPILAPIFENYRFIG